MGAFTDFVRSKLEENESKKVSSNLLKNIIDVIKEYIVTEFDLSEDEKMQVINNMEIGVETHERGVLKNSPKFVANSNYNESEGESVPVEIMVEISTEKIGGKSEVEPAEDTDITGDDEYDMSGEEE